MNHGPLIIPNATHVKIRNENTILLVAFVNDNVQFYANSELIKKLHPKTRYQLGVELERVAKQDFQALII